MELGGLEFELDAPGGDRGALLGLGVGKVVEGVVGEGGDQGAEVGVLEDVGVGVGALGVSQGRRDGGDGADSHRVGGEAALQPAQAALGDRGGEAMIVEGGEGRVGPVEQAVDPEPDRLDPGDVGRELIAGRGRAAAPTPRDRQRRGAEGESPAAQ